MRRMRLAGLVLLLVGMALGARGEPPPAGPLRLSLDEAVKLAATRNTDIVSADWEIAAAEASKQSARGLMLPRLNLGANAALFTGPLEISFADGIPGLPPGTIPPTTVRDQFTWSTQVQIVQPLSLWGLYELYKVRELGVDVARVKRQITARDTAFAVVQAYYRLLQARSLADVAQTSVNQVQTQVDRARAFEAQGVVAHNDVLRAELGLAAARQRLIQMRGTVVLAAGALALAIGISPDTEIEPTTIVTEPPAHAMSLEEAERLAIAHRPELVQLDVVIAQAGRGVRAARSRLIPQVGLAATYQHSEGSSFAEEDSWFIGGQLSWDVWDWGANYYGVKEARARQQQALVARGKLQDALRLEVRSAWISARTAAEALAVARQAEASATENFRIEQSRYENAANTSFDVLDAEAQLTTARGQVQTALFEYLIARAALARATGSLSPEPSGATR